MTFKELEDEIREVLADVASAPHRNDAITMGTYYLLEVVKRLRPRETTRVRVRQLATKAADRRLRNEGADRLKELMQAAPAQEETDETLSNDSQIGVGEPVPGGETDAGDQGTVEREGPGGEETHEGADSGDGGVDTSDGERAGSPVVPSDGAGADDAGADAPIEAADLPDEAPPITPRPPCDPQRTYTVCKRCGRTEGSLEGGARRVWVTQCSSPECR